MPGAGDGLAVQCALPYGASPVEAGVVDGIELTLNIGDGQRLSIHLELPDRTGRDFILPRRTQKGHLQDLRFSFKRRVLPNSGFRLPTSGSGVGSTWTPCN